MGDKQSFSTSEVATYCHVTADTIRKWAEAGRIQVFKTPGGHRRIRRNDLLHFLKDNKLPIHPDFDNGLTTVLIIDHEKPVSALITRLLDRAQGTFQTHIATDAYQAGHHVATHNPSIIFLDLRLPGIDGLEICRHIKSSPNTANTHIIAMSAYCEDETTQRITEHGATLLMQKPFTPDDLRRAFAKTGIEIA